MLCGIPGHRDPQAGLRENCGAFLRIATERTLRSVEQFHAQLGIRPEPIGIEPKFDGLGRLDFGGDQASVIVRIADKKRTKAVTRKR